MCNKVDCARMRVVVAAAAAATAAAAARRGGQRGCFGVIKTNRRRLATPL